jgi:hypothetical protein
MRTTVLLVSGVLAAALVACSAPKDTPEFTTAQKAAPVSAPVPAPAPPAPIVSGPSDPRFIEADLPLLPDNLPYSPRSADVVRQVYAFAAHHGDVLKYVPCFCGCERMGHQGNDECFIQRRTTAGKVTAWEPHGVICEVCLDVAREAMQLHNSGASTQAIRAYIDKKWSGPGMSHTNTPLPPAVKSSGGH